MPPFDGAPPTLASEIHQIWATDVTNNRALYLKTGSVVGRTGCQRISYL